MDDEIMVSICCITYNHEKYIRQALDSFLMQKTNFKYEIIIHDDASTDNTANIIREYEEKYPDIIKPIYEEENQYSKGKKRIMNFTFEKAIGKYIALCEGDDYWIDENKLQMQVDYFETHTNCTFCFHDAHILNIQNNKTERWKWYNKKFWKKDGDYNAGELDLIDFIPTASYMFKKENTKNLPSWFEQAVVGDRALKLIVTSYGYAHYIDRVMSIYRVGIGNSAMDRINKQNEDIEKARKHVDELKWLIDKFNSFTNYEYNDELNKSKNLIQISYLMKKNQLKEVMKEKKYRMLLDYRTKVILLLKIYLPFVHKILKKYKMKKEE